jgi:hypothetical protein
MKGLRTLLLLGTAGCLSGCLRGPAAKPTGILLLDLSPPSATVLIDEQPVAARMGAATLRISLSTGAHRLEIRAPAYFPAYRDLSIARASQSRLMVALRPDPDAELDSQSSTLARPLGQLPSTIPELP